MWRPGCVKYQINYKLPLEEIRNKCMHHYSAKRFMSNKRVYGAFMETKEMNVLGTNEGIHYMSEYSQTC